MSLSVGAIDILYNALSKHRKYGPETKERCSEYAGRTVEDLSEVKTTFLREFFQKKWGKDYMPELICALPANNQELLTFLVDVEKPHAKKSDKVLFRACAKEGDDFIKAVFDKVLLKKNPDVVVAAFSAFPKSLLAEKVKRLVILADIDGRWNPAADFPVARAVVTCIGDRAIIHHSKYWEPFSRVIDEYFLTLEQITNREVVNTAYSLTENKSIEASDLYKELQELADATNPEDVLPYISEELKCQFPYAFASLLAQMRFKSKDNPQEIDGLIASFRETTKHLDVDVRNSIKVLMHIEQLFDTILRKWN